MSVPARKRGRPSASQECVAAFLDELAETGAVAIAAERAGVHRSTLYDLRRRNKDFAARWDAALQLGLDRLQDHAVVRATVGDDTPVWRGRVFQIMARNGHIPPPPYAELDGLRLQPEYVSPMAALQAA